MRIWFATLLLPLWFATPAWSATTDEVEPKDSERIELGAGVSMSRGMSLIDRMQDRNSEAKMFEGVPHLVVTSTAASCFIDLSAQFPPRHARSVRVRAAGAGAVLDLRGHDPLDTAIAVTPAYASMWAAIARICGPLRERNWR